MSMSKASRYSRHKDTEEEEEEEKDMNTADRATDEHPWPTVCEELCLQLQLWRIMGNL